MRYVPVFTIELLHDYFTDSLPDLFRIVPTAETERALSGAGLISKFIQNKLYVFTRHIDDNTPIQAIANNFKLQFFLEVIHFDYSSITNFRSSDPYGRKMFFSNRNSIWDGNEKSVEGILYLSEKLPLFNSANAYRYNDLVRSGSNFTYECLQKVDANTGNLNNSDQFRKLEKVTYVSPQTELEFAGFDTIVNLQVPAAEIDIEYFRYNTVSEQFDTSIKQVNIGVDENPTAQLIPQVNLDFRADNGVALPEEIYRIVINGEERMMYFRPQNDWQQYIGLINIHNDELPETAYRFLQEDGTFYMTPQNEVDTREFIIRFAPAQYLLKYKCKTNKVTDITDEDGVIEFDDLGNNIFQSKRPVRMQEKSIDSINVTYDGADVLKKTKTPGYNNLSLLEGDDEYLVSETFLNL